MIEIKGNSKEGRSGMPELLMKATDMLIHLDSFGRFLTIYLGDSRSSFFAAEEFTGRNLMDLFGETLYSSFMGAIKQTLIQGRFEYEYEIFSDKLRAFSARFSRLKEDEVVCWIKEITTQKETEQALLLSEARYRNLIENLVEVVYEIDSKGILTYISPLVERLYGFKPSEINGQSVSVVLGISETVLEQRLSLLQEKREVRSEHMTLDRYGTEHWINYSTKALYSDGLFRGGIGTLTDVTEIKEKQIALEESEKKFRLVIENISDVLWVLNLNQNKFTFVSPSVFQLLGFTVEEAVRFDIMESLAPDSAERAKIKMAESLKEFLANPSGKKIYTDEVQQKCKDGSLVWIETRIHFQFNEKGEIEIHGTSRNIEKRKKAEFQLMNYAEALRTSEEMFFSVFYHSPVAMVISNPVTKVIIDVNQHLLKTLKLLREEIVSKKFEDLGLIFNEGKQELLGEMLQKGKPVVDFEVRTKNKFGDVLDFLLSVDYITLKDNVYLLTTAVDITILKQNELRVKHFLEQQKLLADISQNLNRPGDFDTVLTEALRMIGIHTGTSRVYIFEDSPDGLSTKNSYEWCNEGIASRKTELQNFKYELIPSWQNLLTFHGKLIASDIKCLPWDIVAVLEPQGIKSILVYNLIVENARYGFIGFHDCKTHRQWTDDEIDLLRTVSSIISNAIERKLVVEKLHQMIESQDKLFSVIAHDLRGPVGSFNQGINLLTGGKITDERIKERLLGELSKTSQTTFRLLENLLNWSVSKTNSIKIEPEPLNLRLIIEENLRLLAASTIQKSINIEIYMDDQLRAFADKDSVNLVIRNLLWNAVKFTREHGMITISAIEKGSKVEVAIKDNGIGMSSQLLGRLFSLNPDFSSPGTNNEKGSGLGLVLCKDFIEKNGGRIWAESSPEEGSRFAFSLPACNTQEDRELE